MISTNSYVFWHWSAIFREFTNTKDHKLNKFSVELVILCVHRLPDDGASVAKHVGIGTYHELCFMFSSLLILLSMFVG